MIQVDNNFFRENCPLCYYNKIKKVGDISYLSPTYFSSQQILIKLKPELWKCGNCKSSFVQNIIPEQIAASLYTDGFSEQRWSNSKFQESKSKEITTALSELFYQNARVLDVGCNTGELLDFAQDKGCKTFGVEYSLPSRALLGQKGHTAFPNLDKATDSYDLITAFDLIEHLYNVPEFFKICYEKLNVKGYLVILTGNISSVSSLLTKSNWWYVQFPEHIVFPSKHYFKVASRFKIKAWIPTYASIGYKYSPLAVLKHLLKDFNKKKYNGLPSLGTDHVLIVLSK